MKRRSLVKAIGAATMVNVVLPDLAKATLVPPFFLDCVVALGYDGPGIQNGIAVPSMWHTIGTGFFYGHLVKDDPELSKKLYSTFLVTAKHVVDGYKKVQASDKNAPGLKIRVNPVDSSLVGKEFDLTKDIADARSA